MLDLLVDSADVDAPVACLPASESAIDGGAAAGLAANDDTQSTAKINQHTPVVNSQLSTLSLLQRLDVGIDDYKVVKRTQEGLQEKPTNCGTKAADVLVKFISCQTLMRRH